MTVVNVLTSIFSLRAQMLLLAEDALESIKQSQQTCLKAGRLLAEHNCKLAVKHNYAVAHYGSVRMITFWAM